MCSPLPRWTSAWRVNRQKYTPYSCVHIEVLHLIRQAETTPVSPSRKSSPCAARNLLMFGDCEAKLCQCLRFLSFLKRRVSSYLHPELNLFAILENSTLRLDCVLSRQVSLNLTNLFDRVLRVSQGFSARPDSALSGNLSRQRRPGSSSSALTLPRSCSLLPGFASFSPSFWCSWSSWNSKSSKAEMADVKQMKKIVPLITCDHPFCQCVCKLVFGVDILDMNLGVQIDSLKQPIKSNSVGSGTYLIVGLRPLKIILTTVSLSSKMYSIAPIRENFALTGT